MVENASNCLFFFFSRASVYVRGMELNSEGVVSDPG